MVGRDGVQNAVSLNSVLTNASRAVAGQLIATAGVGVRFLANPVSFAAVLVAPARIRAEALHPASAAGRDYLCTASSPTRPGRWKGRSTCAGSPDPDSGLARGRAPLPRAGGACIQAPPALATAIAADAGRSRPHAARAYRSVGLGPEFRVVLRLLARIAYVAVRQLKKNL